MWVRNKLNRQQKQLKIEGWIFAIESPSFSCSGFTYIYYMCFVCMCSVCFYMYMYLHHVYRCFSQGYICAGTHKVCLPIIHIHIVYVP